MQNMPKLKTAKRFKKLPHLVIVRAPGLLPMLYTPAELEEELEVPARLIREWLAKGAPHQHDSRGHLWVNGEQFAQWVEQNRVARHTSKLELGAGEAYCFRCRQAVPLENPIEIRRGKQVLLKGQCPKCNATINRGVPDGQPR
jgi:hypothetical protein